MFESLMYISSVMVFSLYLKGALEIKNRIDKIKDDLDAEEKNSADHCGLFQEEEENHEH